MMSTRWRRYLNEPIWSLRSSVTLIEAARLYRAVWRHRVANWTKDQRIDATPRKFRFHLDGALKTVQARVVGGDLAILFEVFAENAYLIPPACLAPESVRVIVDCGAHAGYSAIYFAQRYPNAQIIAVEASPKNFALLVQNTAFEPRIIPVHACISQREGVERFCDEGPTWSYHVDAHGGVEVEAVTLDSLRRRFGFDEIDLVKFDIEGAELSLIQAGLGNVRAVIAEMSADYEEMFATCVAPRRVMRINPEILLAAPPAEAA